jgi:hypothetical protein
MSNNTSATGGYLVPAIADIDDDALDDLFAAAIVGVTGLPGDLVRPRWQEPAPKQPPANVNWCAVGIIDDTADDGAYIVHDPNGGPDGLGQDTLSRCEDLTVLATFYGPSAKRIAKQARDGFAVLQNNESLQSVYISFVNTDTIRAIPELVNGQWVKRYDLRLYFRRALARTYAIQTIETVGVELHVEDKISNINVEPQP